MVKQNFLTKMLLLCALIVGSVSSAWAEDVTYKLTIDANNFNTTSYAANNNEKTSNAVCTTDNTKTYEVKWTSYQVMKNGDNMQWQKSKGYIYNSTDLGTITSVTVTSSAGTFTTYYGTTEQPSSGTTVGNGFFKTVVGGATGTTSKVEVTFTISEGSSTAVATTTTIDATGITNTNVFTSTAAGSLSASVKDGDDNIVESASVTWSGNNDNVATIDTSTGEVTLVAPGTVTFTASYAGVTDQYQASSATYEMTVINEDPNAIILWSEDFSSYNDGDVPSEGTYSYACDNGGGTTRIYNNASTGGTAPELLVAKNDGSFTATIPLNQASGNLKLTYKTNAKAMSVSTTTDGISGGGSSNTYGEHTVTFTDVTTSMTSITIVFTATSGDNVRLDDIVLKGSAQPVAVEAPTFSINGGTYYSAQSVELSCATDGATIYYTTNGDEPTSSSTEYTGAITVSETMTIKAIAVKGNDQSTVSSATYTISEKNDVVFNIDDKSLAYGESYTIKKGNYATADVQTDGNVTLSTSNEAVVSFSGMTITANAVGTATITIAAAEGNTYNEGNTTITVTVTSPDALTTAPEVPSLFKENFNAAKGTGPTGETWGGTIASATFAADNDGWTGTNPYSGNGCARFGTGSSNGSATTPAIAFDSSITYNLTFKAGAWNGDGTTLTVSCDDEEAEIGGTESNSKEFTMLNNAWTTFNTTIKAAEGSKITFATDSKRFFLDDVVVTDPNAEVTFPVSLNAYGYATYCSQFPLDFTNATDYSAWQITDVSGTTITFSQITGSVMGGTGILLKGTPSTTINIASADSENGLTGNKLVGTLAPLYMNAGEYYGLKGNTFVKGTAGTVPACKALLPASLIETTGAPSLTFVFNDDETTGIANVNRETMTNNQYYTLDGRRVANPTKGIYIQNGRKVVIK